MKERPILFSAPMVRAILAGTKTQTRRLVKPQPTKTSGTHRGYPLPLMANDWAWPHPRTSAATTISNRPNGPLGWEIHCPYGQPGDRLYVKESIRRIGKPSDDDERLCESEYIGTKTQTRRLVKPQPDDSAGLLFCIKHPANGGSAANFAHVCERGIHSRELAVTCPYGQPGDWLWVRETWQEVHPLLAEGRESKLGRAGIPGPPKVVYRTIYRADGECANLYHCAEPPFRALSGEAVADEVVWRPSIHMPRWASRITLEITGVRVERLQAISEADCYAEGIPRHTIVGAASDEDFEELARLEYSFLWESINGPGSWDANPWVWVVEFKRIDK